MENIDFIVVYIIAMLCFGVTSTVFYPEQYSFGQDDYVVDAEDYYDDRTIDKNLLEQAWDFISGAVDGIMKLAQFLWACLTFNIPFTPSIGGISICTLITVPFHFGMLYTIARLVRGGG